MTKYLSQQFNEDDLILDGAFGTLPDADELLDDIEADINSDPFDFDKRQRKVNIPYNDLRKSKSNFRIELLINKRWRSFCLSQVQIDRQHKTVIVAIELCKAKNIPYKPEEVIQ